MFDLKQRFELFITVHRFSFNKDVFYCSAWKQQNTVISLKQTNFLKLHKITKLLVKLPNDEFLFFCLHKKTRLFFTRFSQKKPPISKKLLFTNTEVWNSFQSKKKFNESSFDCAHICARRTRHSVLVVCFVYCYELWRHSQLVVTWLSCGFAAFCLRVCYSVIGSNN